MEEVNLRTIEWQAPEYNHKEKGMDFLWTIGLIALLGCIIAIWFHNYVFAIFIFISGACLIMFTLRPPEMMRFSISTEGLMVGKDKHIWSSIKGFNIKVKKGEPNNKLMIVTSRYFLPVYTIPLPVGLTEEVKEDLTKVVPSVEVEESRSMLFMEKLGF